MCQVLKVICIISRKSFLIQGYFLQGCALCQDEHQRNCSKILQEPERYVNITKWLPQWSRILRSCLPLRSLWNSPPVSGLSWVRPSYFFKVNSVHTCITQELTPVQSFSTTVSIICFTYSAYPYHHILNLITSSNTWWRLHIMNCFIIIYLHHTVSFSPVLYTEMPSNYFCPWRWKTKFHTHPKQMKL